MGDVGIGEVREEMWGSALGPHTQTHFPTPPPFLSPHANTLPQSPRTLYHTSPFPTHLSLPSLTLSHTSPLTPCTLPTVSIFTEKA